MLTASVIEKVRSALSEMKRGAPGGEAAWKSAATTLLKYLGNVAATPDEERFRRINTTNAAFVSRIAAVPGALEVLRLVGFQVCGARWAQGRQHWGGRTGVIGCTWSILRWGSHLEQSLIQYI